MDAMRWDPFEQMADLRDRMDRMLEGMLSPSERETGEADSWSPAVDIVETEEALILRADVPGLRQEELEIELDGDTLTLRGQCRAEPEGTVLRQERPQGRPLRSFAIGAPIDQAKAKASYRQGVLEIILPKADEARPRQVRVDVE